MSRRPAIITQADVARVIRAAKREGAGSVEVWPDGSIVIRLSPPIDKGIGGHVEQTEEIVL